MLGIFILTAAFILMFRASITIDNQSPVKIEKVQYEYNCDSALAGPRDAANIPANSITKFYTDFFTPCDGSTIVRMHLDNQKVVSADCGVSMFLGNSRVTLNADLSVSECI